MSLSLALLQSCRADKGEVGQEALSPILFSPCGTYVTTKTTNANYPTDKNKPSDVSTLIKEGNEAGVYGDWVPDWDNQSVYDALFVNRRLRCDAVYYDDPADPTSFDPTDHNSSLWNYDPLEYWKDSGIYIFLAVSPYGASDNVLDRTNHLLKLSYRAGTNKDLMIARNSRDRSTQGKDRVQMSFKHVTSAVRFLFSTAADEGDSYVLTNFHLENIKPRGTLTISTRLQSAIDLSRLDTEGGWTAGAIGVLNTLFAWEADTGSPTYEPMVIRYPGTAHASDPTYYTQMGWYYMVPQELDSGASVSFSVSYNGEDPVTTTINISDSDHTAPDSNPDKWLPNHVYNYYIKLSSGSVNVNVMTQDWTEVDITTDPFMFEG